MTTATFQFSPRIARDYHEFQVPLLFDEYARDLAHTLARGHLRHATPARILETAAGTGALTRHLQRRLPSAEIVATDVNDTMLAIAAGRTRATTRLADAGDLPFADASFDGVACQFGVMFFEDRARAFREAARVLQPRGRFAFNVWDTLEHNRLSQIVHDTVGAMHPAELGSFLSVPFARQDLTAIKEDLEAAGFGQIEIATVDKTSRASSAAEVIRALVTGSAISAVLEELGTLEDAVIEVGRRLVAEFGPGPIAAPMQAIRFLATRRLT